MCMNREVVQNIQYGHRNISVSSPNYREQVAAWTGRLLNREQCVPDGYRFTWKSENGTSSNTAYMYDATMCNVQYAQSQLHKAATLIGKRGYDTCIDAARTYMHIAQDIMPLWTFRPRELYEIVDTTPADIYGHYYLARAMAYANVGRADLTCPRTAHIVAYSNAAHLYAAAAQLISGDTSNMLRLSQVYTGRVLRMRGDAFLEAWDADNDEEGAAKGLACYKEAHQRLIDNGHPGCTDKVVFATERNGVHWLEPILPEWKSLVKARITALPI